MKFAITQKEENQKIIFASELDLSCLDANNPEHCQVIDAACGLIGCGESKRASIRALINMAEERLGFMQEIISFGNKYLERGREKKREKKIHYDEVKCWHKGKITPLKGHVGVALRRIKANRLERAFVLEGQELARFSYGDYVE